jgi:hypothetical protein
MAVKYYTDGNNVFIKFSDDKTAHTADNVPTGAKLITKTEADKILQANKDLIKKYQDEAVLKLEQYKKDRYDRLIRNGWNKTDAAIEAGIGV